MYYESDMTKNYGSELGTTVRSPALEKTREFWPFRPHYPTFFYHYYESSKALSQIKQVVRLTDFWPNFLSHCQLNCRLSKMSAELAVQPSPNYKIQGVGGRAKEKWAVVQVAH
jgi:hypothetical protein